MKNIFILLLLTSCCMTPAMLPESKSPIIDEKQMRASTPENATLKHTLITVIKETESDEDQNYGCCAFLNCCMRHLAYLSPQTAYGPGGAIPEYFAHRELH